MNKECDIVRDLLPLYLDDVCSAASRELVEKHLANCESCKKELEIISAVNKEKNDKKDEKKAFKRFSNKVRKKTAARALSITLAALVMFGGGYQVIYANESVIPYEKDLVNVEIPVDEGLDIHINADNYKRAYSHFVKNDDGTFDGYINATSSVATKLVKDKDTSDNFIRIAGPGMVVDYQSGVSGTDSDLGVSVSLDGAAVSSVDSKGTEDVEYEISGTKETSYTTGKDGEVTEKVIEMELPDNASFSVNNISRIYYYDGDLVDVYSKSKADLEKNGLHLVWERSKNK